MSIRARLTIAVALVLAVTLLLLGVVLVRTTRATLVDQVDDQVLTNSVRARDMVGGRRGNGPGRDDDSGGPPGGDYGPPPAAGDDLTERPVAYLLYSATGQLLYNEPCGFADRPKPLPSVPPIPSNEVDDLVDRIVTVPAVDNSLDYRMLVHQVAGGNLFVTAAPLTAADAAIDRLVSMLVVLGVVALAAAAAASWWLIRRGLRPVDRMVDTAAAIAAGDLSRRVPGGDPRTELGRLGHALNEMLGQIEEGIRARAATEARLRRFVADAAHELRTPLTSLRGYAELYRQGAIPDDAGVANAMGRIESEGGRMARLVDDLLLLARLDQHRALETTPVDVGAMVREAVADFQAVAPDRPVTERYDDHAVVQGDRTRLRQVIDNLLANARTHTPSGTAVRVAVARTASQVEISVADDGPGIPPPDRARVFERFWRADPGRGRSKGGAGLGLSIVASLVEAHGGSIDIGGETGNGTTFTVRLPLANPVMETRPTATREVVPPAVSRPIATPRDAVHPSS